MKGYDLEVTDYNADKVLDWMKNRGGVAVWRSVNLSNLGTSWTTPALTGEGKPSGKPSWQAANEPDKVIADPSRIAVVGEKVVRRFHVGTRMAGSGMALKVTDGGTRRIHAAVAKAGPDAYYRFDYGSYENAVIVVPEFKCSLDKWSETK